MKPIRPVSLLGVLALSGCGFVGGIPDHGSAEDGAGLGGAAAASGGDAAGTGGDSSTETGSGGDGSGGDASGGKGSGGDATGGKGSGGDGSGGDGSGGEGSGGEGSGGDGSGGDGSGGDGSGGDGSGGAVSTCDDSGGDADLDGKCDDEDTCVDEDQDGLGNGHLGNAGCAVATIDTDDESPTACGDTDEDGCDDCVGGDFDPSNDGVDEDGDGFCAVGDCDEELPTCTDDCTTHSDGDGTVDCVERYCGSDPQDSESACTVAETEEELDDAISDVEDSDEYSYILVGSVTLTSPLSDLKGEEGVTIRPVPGSVITVNYGAASRVLKISGDNALLDGLSFRNTSNAKTVIEVSGDDNELRNLRIDGFIENGIFILGGDRVELYNNWISGGTAEVASGHAAFVIRDSEDSIVQGNIAAQGTTAGFQLRKTQGLYFDHNTSADNGGAGFHLDSDASDSTCMRNNLASGNAGAAIWIEKDGNTFNGTLTCIGVLPGSHDYGNGSHDNASGTCTGYCAELPAGEFWEHSANPLYVSTTFSSSRYYCLGTSGLVDGGHNISWYDLNGVESGQFNGAAPEVGARESGPGGGCQ